MPNQRTLSGDDLTMLNARVWASPDSSIGEPETVEVRNGRIMGRGTASGSHRHSDSIIDVDGRVLTAGFVNSHVHLTESVWSSAAKRSAAELQPALDDMFLSRGLATVLDLASQPLDTGALIRRIDDGELNGPEILTAGAGIRPWAGTPFYIKVFVPWFARWLMPAHRRGLRVLAHPSNPEGTGIAIAAGVAALAHVPDETEGTEALLAEAARQGIRIVPTLHMFASTVTTDESYLTPIRTALNKFIRAGGHVLFGTDVGYMADRETRPEITAMHEAGMSASDILRSLTLAPAEFLGRSDSGTVKPGNRADFTVLETTSALPDATDFADVHAVIRAGRVLWSNHAEVKR